MYIYMYIHTYVCVYIYMYACTYVCTYVRIGDKSHESTTDLMDTKIITIDRQEILVTKVSKNGGLR